MSNAQLIYGLHAVQSLLRINPRDWPKDDAKATLEVAMKFIRSLPVAERTAPLAGLMAIRVSNLLSWRPGSRSR